MTILSTVDHHVPQLQTLPFIVHRKQHEFIRSLANFLSHTCPKKLLNKKQEAPKRARRTDLSFSLCFHPTSRAYTVHPPRPSHYRRVPATYPHLAPGCAHAALRTPRVVFRLQLNTHPRPSNISPICPTFSAGLPDPGVTLRIRHSGGRRVAVGPTAGEGGGLGVGPTADRTNRSFRSAGSREVGRSRPGTDPVHTRTSESGSSSSWSPVATLTAFGFRQSIHWVHWTSSSEGSSQLVQETPLDWSKMRMLVATFCEARILCMCEPFGLLKLSALSKAYIRTSHFTFHVLLAAHSSVEQLSPVGGWVRSTYRARRHTLMLALSVYCAKILSL